MVLSDGSRVAESSHSFPSALGATGYRWLVVQPNGSLDVTRLQAIDIDGSTVPVDCGFHSQGPVGPPITTTTVSLPNPIAMTFAAGSLWVVDDDGLVRLDATGRVVAILHGVRGMLAGDDRSIWAVTPSGQFRRVDPHTNSIADAFSLPLHGREITDVAIGGGRVWAVEESPPSPKDTWLLEVDPASGRIVFAAQPTCAGASECVVTDLAADSSAAYAAFVRNGKSGVFRLGVDGTVATGTPTQDSERGLSLARAAGGLWGAGVGVDRFDPATLRTLAHRFIPGIEPPDQVEVAASAGSVWVLVEEGPLFQLDPSTLRVLNRVDSPPGLSGLAGTPDGVWLIAGDRLVGFRDLIPAE
jgi:hypothetical protein